MEKHRPIVVKTILKERLTPPDVKAYNIVTEIQSVVLTKGNTYRTKRKRIWNYLYRPHTNTLNSF